MKIAILGNMNNNGFALMRYFRDLGAEADLLLYANDGRGGLSHFAVEADSWELERWSGYIHRTKLLNAPISALDFPFGQMLGLRSLVAGAGSQRPVTRRAIRRELAGYDAYIVSGIGPALLWRAGIRADIFFPYSVGVEFLKTKEFTSKITGMRRLFYPRVVRAQTAGIRAARHVVNAELGFTAEVLAELGVENTPLAMPMVYPEKMPDQVENPELREVLEDIASQEFSVLHHLRLYWQNPGYDAETWAIDCKHNDWSIRAFARLVNTYPDRRIRLYILEYGPDVAATRALIAELGITAAVRWIPVSPRRELFLILSRVSACFGEYLSPARTLWGGVGWEALAQGTPLIHGFRFTEGEFDAIYGYPEPPLVKANTSEEVASQLEELFTNPGARRALSAAATEWFHQHNGRAMAQKWLQVLGHQENLENAYER